MSQWKSDDSAANTPLWTPATVKLPSNTGNQTDLFGNTTAGAFVTGATVGVFGVDDAETQWDQWELLGVSPGSNVGSAVVLTSNSTTGYQVNGGTASVNAIINVDTLSVGTVGVNAAGEGYTNGDIVVITASGTGDQARFSVTANATGNVTAVAQVAGFPGDYSVFPDTAGANTSNVTGSGTGLRLDLTAGVGTMSVSNGGTFTVLPTTLDNNALTEQAGQANTTTTVNLIFRKSTTPVTHAGYVKVTTGSGGRAGRVTSETLVAVSSMSGDAEDVLFPNT